MAEKIFTNVRLGLKVDTLENWKSSSLVLKRGEVAFATVAAEAGTGLTEPVVMMKIGDGEKTFSQLGFDFYAKASDVLAACKSEATLKTFINGVITDAGVATDEALSTLSGRVTTAEGKITALEGKMITAEGKISANETAIGTLNGLVGDKRVAVQIQEYVDNLKLGETYAAKSLEKTVSDHVADTVAHVTTADKTKWNGALQASDIATGAENGTIAVKGTDVAVKGLGSAAFTEASAYDISGAAATAESNAKAYAKEYADGLAGNYDAKGAAAAAESAAKAYADGLAGNYDAAGSAADALEEAKGYTDSEMERLVGDTPVATQISTQIANLKLSETYDAKGAAAAAETAAKSHADGLNTAMNTRVEALEAIDHDHSNKTVLDGITAEKVSAWDAAEQNAKDHADDLDEAMDARVQALEAKFGDGEGNVEAQIEAAVAAEAKLRDDADKELAADIKAITDDYLTSVEEKALQDQITANAGDIAALQGLVGDKKVSEAIAAEAKAREDADTALGNRVKAIEDDYLKAADKEALQNQINTIMSNPDAEGAINSINEFTQYVKDHGTIAEGMRTDINKNKDDIAAMDTAYKAADTALSGRIDKLEAIDHDAYVAADTALETKLNAEIAKKAAQTDLEALDDRVEVVEGELNTATTGLKARMTQAEADIDALEEKVGDKKVSEQISAITNPLDARIVELEKVDHSHANAAELDKFVDGDKAKLDSAVQTVTAGTGLTATKTGTDVAIEIDDTLTWIFDCGTSAE